MFQHVFCLLTPLIFCCWVATLPAALIASEPELVQAVRHQDFERATHLLTDGADPNSGSADGTTALHWAVHWNAIEVMDQLLEHQADVDAVSQFGVRPLMLACVNGSHSAVQRLLSAGADARQVNVGGEPVILTAARTGNPEIVKLLLQSGADVEATEARNSQTALMWAAAEGHLEALHILLQAGANTNRRSEGGFTAFLFAVRQGHVNVVKALLAAGADVNQWLANSTSSGWNGESIDDSERGPSALGLATLNGHFELAAMLLDAGADPNYRWQGRTVLHEITWIRKPGAGTNDPKPQGSGRMSSLELVRRLVKSGADINARMTGRKGGPRTVLNLKGATPFLLAARTADAELMRLLAELGADPLLANEDETTPLLVAAGVGVQSPGEDPGTPAEVLEAVKVALALGGDINAVDRRGETVMHGVAYKYAASTVHYLAEQGARIEVWNRQNKNGWTPLRIATGVHRTMNLRSSPETAAAIRDLMLAAGVSTEIDPETNISGATN